MRKIWLQVISIFSLFLLSAYSLIGGIPVQAEMNQSLQLTLTTEGEPYIAGNITSAPVTIQVTVTTADRANLQVELSRDAGNTWTIFDTTSPLIVTEPGDHSIWFRVAGQSDIYKQTIRIAVPQTTQLAASKIIYVKANVAGGTGDGTSWKNAFIDLQSALERATPGDQIWIAQGIYTPTRLDNVRDARTAHFRMKNGVAIYGGFKGEQDEEIVDNRDLTQNKTILSGELPSGEVAYHVFYHPNNYDVKLNATAILDGVTITKGQADGYSIFHQHGGGMFNSGNHPTLRNVIFSGNHANQYGGGMYNLGSSPTLMNVEFHDNKAVLGGGIYNGNMSTPTITNGIFSQNKVTESGGGIYNGASHTTIESATFIDNEAGYYGGGMANFSGSDTILTDVTFSGNIALQQGGGMYNRKSLPSLTSVKFVQNKAEWFGGGMRNEMSSHAILQNVLFIENEANAGGGMANTESAPQLNKVEFYRNNAKIRYGVGGNGAGIQNNRSNPILKDVKFYGNIADAWGGGIYNQFDSHPTIIDVGFHSNTAMQGGALFNEASHPTLMNALFASNNATNRIGSAIYNYINGDVSIINATISDNGPIAIVGGSENSKIINSIIIGNGNSVALSNFLGKVTNSLLDVFANGLGYKGQLYDANEKPISQAIYTLEDVFLNPISGYYHLKLGGPAIDVGDSTANSLPHDLVGRKRIQGKAIDLGVYEATQYYKVTYDSNNAVGGQVPQDNTHYQENKTVTVQGNSGNLVREGYIFTGWNTQADGKGTTYQANDVFPIGTADVMLYAQWTKPNTSTYTVIYHANGATSGTVPQDNTHYQENKTVTVQGNSGNLVREGYIFAGWNTQADGKGTTYQANDVFPIGTADVMLYAQWTKPNTSTYSVIYHANGATSGTVPQDSTQYEENKTVTVQGNSGQLVRTGYTFAGWNTQADGKGISYVENATFQMGKADVTLYAQWASNPSTPNEGNVTGPSTSEGNNSANPSRSIQISLETNGGLSLKDIEIAYNTTVSDLPIPTREGFRFAGWYQDKELTKPWDKGTLVKESLTLYAKWTALPEEEAESSKDSQPPKTPQPLLPIVTFQDIENHWAQEIIEALATRGIITGYKDGTFRPNETISRQHVAVLLTRAFTFEASRPSIAFSDVAPHHPYYHEITILQQAGIIDGIDGAFHPADHLTRAQLAKILANTLQLQPQTTSSFTDVDSSHWSAGYIGALERAGIALGDNGKFRPEASVTRAQLAAFLYRAMQQ
ncbi:InlB B-repeat-containing protein [Lysinibacillus tabacifolii]|uniref:SLH domain-containing protein n=1 Tax=Lysinibacillus tabacifolii TaxID=1173107 RepID=A0ABY2SYW5_9BACI|nr:InlB B-repeat-containing protein [Lysinibacillus tabacifolii]TKI48052.1 hypothetical protein FC748_10450 [Lysinibacillus tabacifolii]